MHSKLNHKISTDKIFPDTYPRKNDRLAITLLKVGDVLSHRELVTIRSDTVQIPDPKKLVHLQFRRYAGCPVCNLHLRSIAQRHDEILAAGIREVVVFHSTAETMREFQGQLPFAAIADPEKKLYAEFRADRKMSPIAALDPRTWLAAAHALIKTPSLRGASGKGEKHMGLPAEFIIDSDGRVLAKKYGKRVDDHWSVNELLDLAKLAGTKI
jgi:peroxiredoxin